MIAPRFRHATCDSNLDVIQRFGSSVPVEWLKPAERKLQMKVANLYSSDPILGNIIFFQNHAELFRRMNFSSPSEVPRSKSSAEVTVAAEEPFRRKMEEPLAQSPLEELFALKRAEKPPENFMQDFLKEFHRRNPGSGPKERS